MVFNVKNDHIPTSLIPPAVRPWIALAVALVLIQLIPDAGTWIRYDRNAIGNGELWRLLTGNFIHLGWGHLALNAAGLLAIGWLFAEDYSLRDWGMILLVCALATSVGLYLFNPEIYWCVGLSGALHGLYTAGAVAWLFEGAAIGAGLLAGGAAKIVYEQVTGALPFSESTVGGTVVTDAHLWGAIGGVVVALALGLWHRKHARL